MCVDDWVLSLHRMRCCQGEVQVTFTRLAHEPVSNADDRTTTPTTDGASEASFTTPGREINSPAGRTERGLLFIAIVGVNENLQKRRDDDKADDGFIAPVKAGAKEI